MTPWEFMSALMWVMAATAVAGILVLIILVGQMIFEDTRKAYWIWRANRHR
jgi:hypothetical protein